MFSSAAFSICDSLEAAFVWSVFLYILLIVVIKSPNVTGKGKGKAVNIEHPLTVNNDQ